MIGRRAHIEKHPLTAVYVLCLCALISGCQRTSENSERIAKKANHKNFDTKSSEKESDFVVETITENYANVKLAQLAMERSSNETIKETASAIESDHKKLIRELKGFSNMRGISIPLEENANARKKLDDLRNADNEAFDKRWCTELVNRHEDAVQDLEDMWKRTTDDELKKWINSALPGLRNDLVKLNSCHEKLTM